MLLRGGNKSVLSQPVLDEVVLHIGEVEEDAKEIDDEGEPEGSGIA